jgi:hypothetical protein
MQFYYRVCISLPFIFYFHTVSYSQVVLIPFREKQLWGYADTNGVIQIKPAFDKAGFFYNARTTAEVYKDKKVTVINKSGKSLFPFSDSYYQFAGTYIVTQKSKKGIYSDKGVMILPVNYDDFEYTDGFEKYRKQYDKLIAVRNNKYYLVTPRTGKIEKIPKPIKHQVSGTFVGIAEAPFDEKNITSSPFPQLQSRDFPKLNSYSDLIHCRTIYMNDKPVFYLFCPRKDQNMDGYIGQNGVKFYKD